MRFEIEISSDEIQAEIGKKVRSAVKRHLKGEWVNVCVRDEILRQIEIAVAKGFPESDLDAKVNNLLDEEKVEVARLVSEASVRVKEKLSALEAEIDKLRPRDQFERKIDNHLRWACFRAMGVKIEDDADLMNSGTDEYKFK